MNIIFDLDGTLVNTIADLGGACNYALTQLGLPTHSIADYPAMVGNGINRLIERALPEDKKEFPELTQVWVERMRAYFVPYYNEHNCDLTVPYSGIYSLLDQLRVQGHCMGVASNKYQAATEKIIAHFFPNMFCVVLGERQGIERKPHPQIVYDILKQMPKQRTLYVGDSLVDIATARNANVPIMACTWGFVNKKTLKEAHPDWLVDTVKPVRLQDSVI